MRAFLVTLVAGAVIAGGYLLTPGSITTAAPDGAAPAAAPVPPPTAPSRLVAHEWLCWN